MEEIVRIHCRWLTALEHKNLLYTCICPEQHCIKIKSWGQARCFVSSTANAAWLGFVLYAPRPHCLPHILNPSASRSPFIHLPLPKTPSKYSCSSPGPSRTGKRQHVIAAWSTCAWWWLTGVHGLAGHRRVKPKRQVSVSFPLRKDSNLAMSVYSDSTSVHGLYRNFMSLRPLAPVISEVSRGVLHAQSMKEQVLTKVIT